MFDFSEMINFGIKIEAHGEEWIYIKSLPNRCYLAIRPTDTLPCQVHLIQKDDPDKN